MKKILAFLLAMTTCFCAFTACGSTDDDDDSSKSRSRKSSSVKDDDDDEDDDDEDDDKDKDKDDDDDEDDDDKPSKSDKKKSDKKSDKDADDSKNSGKDTTDEDDDKDIDKDDKKDENKGGSSANEDGAVYLELFTSFCNNPMTKDTEKLMELTFPDKLIDAMKKTNSFDFMAEEINGSYDAMDEIDLSMISVSKVEDCDAQTKENLEKLYSVYSNLFIAMAENDIMYDQMESGDIDETKLLLILEPAMQLSQLDDIENLDVKISIPFEEAKTVTFTADGDDQEFVMYKLKGEGWKIDTIGFAFFDL